jgi:hypothetical protein
MYILMFRFFIFSKLDFSIKSFISFSSYSLLSTIWRNGGEGHAGIIEENR